MAITLVGSIALDSLRTPKGEVSDVLGGTAIHFTNAASILSSELNLIGVVGSDFPKDGFEFFKKKNVDVEGLEIINDGKTFKWKGQYEKDMNTAVTLETQLNVFENFRPKIPEKYQNTDFLFLGNIGPDLQLDVLNKLKYKYASVLDTMNLWINHHKEDLLKVVKKVEIIIVNNQEVCDLTGIDNIVKAGKQVLLMGPKYVIVKKGEHGVSLYAKDEQVFSIPSFPINEVIDPTGAGDSFAGGVVSYLNTKGKVTFEVLKKAVIYGNIIASYNVQNFGIDGLKNITLKDVKKRFKEYKDYTCIPSSLNI